MSLYNVVLAFAIWPKKAMTGVCPPSLKMADGIGTSVKTRKSVDNCEQQPANRTEAGRKKDCTLREKRIRE
jgi:hypothetical protein